MENYERYQRIQLVRMESDRDEMEIPLTEAEGTFLKEMLAMPESHAFIDEKFRMDLQARVGHCQESSTQRLGEFRVSENWHDEKYVEKARKAMEIVQQDVDFHYQNRTFQGEIREGTGCPIAIQVDLFTREWYMNFIDVDSGTEVLANLNRLTFLATENSASFCREEKKRIKEGRRNYKLTLAVKNEKGAMERACALFALKQRFMRHDRDTDELILEISYCDYEKEEILSDILSLEELAVIREPKELREEVLHIVEGMLELYG